MQRETYQRSPIWLLRTTPQHTYTTFDSAGIELRAMSPWGEPATTELGYQLFLRLFRCCSIGLSMEASSRSFEKS